VDDGSEPIADDEILYRRVPLVHYSADGGLVDQAFAPHKIRDATGISISRAKYKSIEEAARGGSGKPFYVAVMQAVILRQHGIEPVPRPIVDDPGHAELPDLNAANCRSDRTLELQRVLVELTLRVEGPFGPV
jgi:hypothetical protein